MQLIYPFPSITVNPNIFESLLFSEFTSINRLAPFKFSDQVINQQLIIIIIIVKHFSLCSGNSVLDPCFFKTLDDQVFFSTQSFVSPNKPPSMDGLKNGSAQVRLNSTVPFPCQGHSGQLLHTN